MKGEHVHTPRDGRGPRAVTVNGRPVHRIVLADTRRGVARQHVGLNGRRTRLLYRTLRGVVEVAPC